jgi:hypothetical protein
MLDLKLLWDKKTCKINKLILFLQNMQNKQNHPTQFYVDPCRVPKKKRLENMLDKAHWGYLISLENTLLLLTLYMFRFMIKLASTLPWL